MAHPRLRTLVLAALAVLVAIAALAAAPSFPTLTGRVVDQAAVLDPAAEERLTAKLADLEAKTTTQLVVVTLRSLQGYDIADYGYQLGRHWGIGQKGTNNGALLIVAPTERKVRIEVGYGLEGMLTDAVTRLIIDNAILPRFRTGDFSGGIERGVDDIIQVLSGDAEDFKKRAAERSGRPSGGKGLSSFAIVLIILGIWFFLLLRRSQRQRLASRRRSGWWAPPILGGGWGGGRSGGGWGGGPAAGSPAAAARSAAADRLGELVTCLCNLHRRRPSSASRTRSVRPKPIRPARFTWWSLGEADEFRLVPVLWAAIVALIVPWILHFLTYWSAGTILLLQVLTFVVDRPRRVPSRRCATGSCPRASRPRRRGRRRWRNSWPMACTSRKTAPVFSFTSPSPTDASRSLPMPASTARSNKPHGMNLPKASCEPRGTGCWRTAW